MSNTKCCKAEMINILKCNAATANEKAKCYTISNYMHMGKKYIIYIYMCVVCVLCSNNYINMWHTKKHVYIHEEILYTHVVETAIAHNFTLVNKQIDK